MKHILADLLHLFVIVMMVIFVIGGIMAATGTFDHWTERYNLKRRRRRLIKDKSKNIKGGNSTYSAPYYSTRPDKKSVSYTGNT